jgi:hypothetical protein
MTSEWNILEDILKNQKPIDAQIQSAEKELAALNALESLPDYAEKALLATGRYLGYEIEDEQS